MGVRLACYARGSHSQPAQVDPICVKRGIHRYDMLVQSVLAGWRNFADFPQRDMVIFDCFHIYSIATLEIQSRRAWLMRSRSFIPASDYPPMLKEGWYLAVGTMSELAVYRESIDLFYEPLSKLGWHWLLASTSSHNGWCLQRMGSSSRYST